MFNKPTDIHKLQVDLEEQIEYVKGLSTAMEKSLEENADLKIDLEKALTAAKKKKRYRGKNVVFKGTRATTENTPAEYWPLQSKFRIDQDAALSLHNFTPLYIVSSGPWSMGSVERILQQSILGRAVKIIRGKGKKGLVTREEWLANYEAADPAQGELNV
jgi:hypothetical protein